MKNRVKNMVKCICCIILLKSIYQYFVLCNHLLQMLTVNITALSMNKSIEIQSLQGKNYFHRTFHFILCIMFLALLSAFQKHSYSHGLLNECCYYIGSWADRSPLHEAASQGRLLSLKTLLSQVKAVFLKLLNFLMLLNLSA